MSAAKNVYNDMIENYAEYGIVADDGRKCPVNTVSCFGDVLYQIGLTGTLHDNVLTVNINDFINNSSRPRRNGTIVIRTRMTWRAAQISQLLP
jgi:hypothetical protein